MLYVKMKGELTPEVVDEDFMAALDSLNNAGMNGKNFVLMDKPDGKHCLLNLQNILSITEDEDE